MSFTVRHIMATMPGKIICSFAILFISRVFGLSKYSKKSLFFVTFAA